MNTTTRRHPRTLNEAFGPYCGCQIVEQPDPMPKADRIVVGICAAAAMALIAMVAVGWL